MNSKKPAFNSIDEYIATFPKPIQKILHQVRKTIATAAPDAVEKISYQIPTFWQNENLIHFAAYEHHIGLYPTSSGIAKFKKELAIYKSAKGSVQFPIDQPIPLELISRITAFRVSEVSKKTTKKR